MGAWGHRTFEDDTSLDLVDDWMEAADPEAEIAQALTDAIATQAPDYTQGHVISVAAAVLDYVLANTDPDEDADLDDFQVWLDALGSTRLRALLPSVLRGLDLLLADESELAQLWSENEELYPRWRQVVLDRRTRLSRISQDA